MAGQASRLAFTLAEVLITLGIIGVVAALTMPSLITKYQKNVTAERLKKVYSVLSNAAKRSELDTGEEAKYWQYPQNPYDLDFIPFFQKHYIPYLNIASECISANCFSKEHYSFENNRGGFLANYIVKLSDGTLLSFLPSSGSNGRGYIWVYADINGKKGPNREGRDIFVLDIAPSYTEASQARTVKFYGINQSDAGLKTHHDYGCSKAVRESGTIYAGHFCGERIMRNGWKIPDDDYPW